MEKILLNIKEIILSVRKATGFGELAGSLLCVNDLLDEAYGLVGRNEELGVSSSRIMLAREVFQGEISAKQGELIKILMANPYARFQGPGRSPSSFGGHGSIIEGFEQIELPGQANLITVMFKLFSQENCFRSLNVPWLNRRVKQREMAAYSNGVMQMPLSLACLSGTRRKFLLDQCFEIDLAETFSQFGEVDPRKLGVPGSENKRTLYIPAIDIVNQRYLWFLRDLAMAIEQVDNSFLAKAKDTLSSLLEFFEGSKVLDFPESHVGVGGKEINLQTVLKLLKSSFYVQTSGYSNLVFVSASFFL